ncbi:MAG: hypothetical protein KKG97_06465 [Proteobacteria bacterium]|nr:hypothetical protein [Pseudomonadota bacterium]
MTQRSDKRGRFSKVSSIQMKETNHHIFMSPFPPLSIRKIEKIVFENQLLLMGKYNEFQYK